MILHTRVKLAAKEKRWDPGADFATPDQLDRFWVPPSYVGDLRPVRAASRSLMAPTSSRAVPTFRPSNGGLISNEHHDQRFLEDPPLLLPLLDFELPLDLELLDLDPLDLELLERPDDFG